MRLATAYRLLLDPEPVAEGTEAPAKASEAAKAPPTLDEMRKVVEERGVDSAARMLLELSEDNFKYRSRLREAEGRVPEGAVVLKGEDARRWEKFKALGDPASVEKELAEGRDAKGWQARRLKEDNLASVAELHGWKPSVLKRLGAELEVEVGEHPTEKADGKPVRVGFVVTRGDDGKEQGRKPLDEYAREQWGDFMPALKGEPERLTAAQRPDPRDPKVAAEQSRPPALTGAF